jgi:SPP1 gp7 family putative phage head morphogenesis protein
MFQGFSMTEKILGPFMFEGSPFIGLHRLMPKPYGSFKFHTDEFGNIEKVEQEFESKKQIIDLSKFIYFVQNPDMDFHYGQSELREAYRSWYSKDVAIRFYNIFLEKLAGGMTIAKPSSGRTIPEGSKEYQALKAVIEHMQTATAVLLPADIDIESISPKSTDQFEKAIVMHDLQIAKALLVPNLLGVTHTGQTGSFAQSTTQLEAFLWTLDADANRLEDAVNEQLINPIGVVNFADGISPKFRFKPVSEQKKLEIIKTWADLVGKSAVEVSDTDENHLRELLDFPEKGEPIEISSSDIPEDDPELPDETVIGQPVKISPNVAFDRASKRVSISVIDKKSFDIEESFTIKAVARIEEMVADMGIRILDENLGTPIQTMQPNQVDFNQKEKTKVRREIEKALKSSWKLGEKHSLDELAKARKEPFNLSMARIDTNANSFLKSNAIRLTNDLSDSMRKTVQGLLANAIKYSWTPKETVRRVYDSLTKGGFIFLSTNAESTGRTVGEVLEAIGESAGNAHRVRTAIRTNTFEAINEARYSVFSDPDLEGFVEALEYSAILDARTTDICRHLDDRVYPIDSLEWNKYRPPNHFNCRSILIPVTIIDTEVTGKDKRSNSRWSKQPRKEPQQGFGGETG